MRCCRLILSVVLLTFAFCSISPAEVNLLAMGDWGSNASPQKKVASELSEYVQKSSKKFDGMLLAGDNFYTALTSTTQPMWQTMFEQMYDPKVLDFPFYVSLGNHDYQNGKNLIELAYAKENPNSRWKFPSNYYRVDLPADHPLASILMLDSNRQVMTDDQWNAETKWLKSELDKPRPGKWLVACAHHPLYSNGNHGDNGVLQKDWGDLFARHKLDMYICGHDHDLQHLELPGVFSSFILVGGGGQGIRPMRVDQRGPFSKSSYGFASINLNPETLTIQLISSDGQILHEFRRTLDGHVEILQSVPSDTATTRSIGSITRDNESTAKSKKKDAD